MRMVAVSGVAIEVIGMGDAENSYVVATGPNFEGVYQVSYGRVSVNAVTLGLNRGATVVIVPIDEGGERRPWEDVDRTGATPPDLAGSSQTVATDGGKES